MPILNDQLRKGWISRLFREARSDLYASYNIEKPFISANLILQSMKKLEKAIFLCLGEPNIIQEILLSEIICENVFYKTLFFIQKSINYWTDMILSFEIINTSVILAETELIFNFARIIINNFTDEVIPQHLMSFPVK